MSKILEKTFPNLEKLNDFIEKNPVEFVSISDRQVEKVFDLPFFDGKLRYYKDTEYVLFYREIEENM